MILENDILNNKPVFEDFDDDILLLFLWNSNILKICILFDCSDHLLNMLLLFLWTLNLLKICVLFEAPDVLFDAPDKPDLINHVVVFWKKIWYVPVISRLINMCILLMDNQIMITCMIFNILHVFGKGLGGWVF